MMFVVQVLMPILDPITTLATPKRVLEFSFCLLGVKPGREKDQG